MEFRWRRHLTDLIGVPERKKKKKTREKEKELIFKDKIVITRNTKRNCVFVLENHKIPLQDKNVIFVKKEKEDHLERLKITWITGVLSI